MLLLYVGESTWLSMWFIGTNGLFSPIANDLAKVEPIRSGPINPGPHVEAKTSISEISFPLSFKAAWVIFCNISRCALEANSGTTPPCFL